MANLFWKTEQGTKSLVTTPFKTEEEFEKLVFDTPEILEDVFLLKRQVRGGSKSGVPDIVGIDNDGNVCIIEMKNVAVNAAIIPQVLQYAFWAETSPDSIKSLWLECEDKPEELELSWDSFQVRIIVIAPQIYRSTLDIVDKINYPVDLVEIKRWVEGDSTFLHVNRLEPDKPDTKHKPTAGLQVYDAEFYKKEYNKQSAKEFLKYVKAVEELINENGWNLETKFNKHYCGFKAGFFNAFGIKWVGSRTFTFFFKLSEAEARELAPEMTKYVSAWKEAYYYIDPKQTKVSDFKPLFEKAYRKLTGD